MNYFWAFCVGGAICVAGQLLIDLTGLTPARILTGYVVAGVVLSAIGWYAPLAEFAGCGATVPLLGFGHLLAKGVRTALQEEGAVGILTGGLTAAAAGVTTSLVCGPPPFALFFHRTAVNCAKQEVMRMKHRWTTLLWELWAAQALCAVAALPPGSAFHTCPALALPGLALAAAVPTAWAAWALLAEPPDGLPPEQLLEQAPGFDFATLCDFERPAAVP